MPLSQPLRLHELSPEERKAYDSLDPARMPEHVAIIMDGNGRWAGNRALKRIMGHQRGADSVYLVADTAARINLPYLTLYAFSIENNLRRPPAEVSFLMKLLRSYLTNNVKRMNEMNVRMKYIGRTTELPAEVRDTMAWAEEETAKNDGTVLTLALNYGSRAEIVDASRTVLKRAIAEAARRGCSVEDLLAVDDAVFNEESLSSAMYTGQMPDPDLVVRTSGEMRISNFLLWQLAYSELVVTDRLWPDFNGLHLIEAIGQFQKRERRFGGIAIDSDERMPETETIQH